MDGELWSLRNKLQDLLKAMSAGNQAAAQMYALELERRLEHAEAAWTEIKAALEKRDGH